MVDQPTGGLQSTTINMTDLGVVGPSFTVLWAGSVGPPGGGSALQTKNLVSEFDLNGSTSPSAGGQGPEGLAGVGPIGSHLNLQNGTTFFVNGNMAIGAAGNTVSTGPVPTDSLYVYGQGIYVGSVTLQSNLGVTSNGSSSYITTYSTNAAGPYAVDISTTGHLNSQSISGSTVTSCGANASVTGSDVAGTITTGSGAPTACTLTFAKPFTNTPVCVCSPNAGVSCGVSSSSNSSVTFALSVTETKINYICIGSD